MNAVADSITHENVSDLIEELRHEAGPLIERAVPMIEQVAEHVSGRRKRRRSKLPFIVVGLLAVAGVVAYLLWQRRDEEPAYLVHEPDLPDVTPAGMPDAPSSETPSGGSPDSSPAAPDDESPSHPVDAPAREFAGTPHASIEGEARGERDDRPADAAPPPFARHAPYVTSPVHLPSTPRPWSWR